MTDSTRAPRYLGRHTLRKITTVSACLDCGRQSIISGGNVGVRKSPTGTVGFAGLATCGRIWLCPVCNAKIMARRAVEVGAALTWATVEGYQVIWGSLTIRHNQFSDLEDLIDKQTKAWRFVVSSKSWRKASATITVGHLHSPSCDDECARKRDTLLTTDLGRVGYIRASEVTIGANGWHPHFHPVIIWNGSAAAAQEFADEVVALWIDGVERAGGEAVRNGAQQLKVITGVEIFDALSGYITKATYDPAKLALETVWSQGKNGRGRAKETVSHWSLLASIEQGLADETERWWELESATAGHRALSWSRGLRSFAGIGDEVDDETLAAEEVGSKEDTVAVITARGWVAVRDRPEVLAQILDVLHSTAGVAGLALLLDAYGIEWTTVEGLADADGDHQKDFYADSRSEEAAARWASEKEDRYA